MNSFLAEEVKDNWVYWNILMPALRVFNETMFRGVPIDPYKVLELNELLRKDIARDEEELWEMAGRVFNPASPKDVAEIIYDDLKVPMDPRYGRSTNKKLFEQIKDEHEILSRIFEHREMVHDLDQYVIGFAKRIDREFKVHPSIKLFGTVTGRISSEDPSVMNVKRDSAVKEVFVANEGKLLAEFDLKGAELRWYCMYAKDEVLKDILINGYQGDLGFPLTDEQRRDPHYIIGAIAYGQARAKELRAAAKMTVFGRIYLRGLASIERQYGKEVGQRLVAVMDELIPSHRAYTQLKKEEVRNQGYVESYFKRRRRFPLVTRENASEYQRMAVNMPIQSASSDLNLLNLIWLYEHKDEYDVWPMFTVHDSIMTEIPDVSVIAPIKKAMEENANRIVKGEMEFIYDVKVGRNWGQAKEWKEGVAV
jgi:DNA polymerase-1